MIPHLAAQGAFNRDYASIGENEQPENALDEAYVMRTELENLLENTESFRKAESLIDEANDVRFT